MVYDEITPYLNKIVRLNLKNKKRKVGWLLADNYHEVLENPLSEVYCVNVLHGKKLDLKNSVNIKSVVPYSEIIQIEDIMTIRSPRD